MKMISADDSKELLENAGMLIHELIMKDPMMYIQPHFHDYIVDQVAQLLGKQLDQVFFGAFTYGDIVKNTLCDELDLIIQRAMKVFYRYIAPLRSYSSTFIRVKPNIETMKGKINYLKSIPQPVQRTTEWYNFRWTCLTASNIWKAFISDSTKNQLIYEKCLPIDTNKFSFVSTESSMHWGNKYEPVSIMLYERKYKTQISDFGCIPHKTISFLAASPDGINTLESSDRFGRMIEVKNIVNRDIDGIPKMEYWVQMQLQMEVCNLNECDFLETRFTEYESYDAFEADSYDSITDEIDPCRPPPTARAAATDEEFDRIRGQGGRAPSYIHAKDGSNKGVMIMYFTRDNPPKPHYEYAPMGLTKHGFEKWENENLKKHEHMIWIKNIYWKLDEMSCVLVLRNKLWFAHALPQLQELWTTIEHDRINGFGHRAPNKKNRTSKSSESDITSGIGKCYINIIDVIKEGAEDSVKVEDSVVNSIVEVEDTIVDTADKVEDSIVEVEDSIVEVEDKVEDVKIIKPIQTLYHYFKKVDSV